MALDPLDHRTARSNHWSQPIAFLLPYAGVRRNRSSVRRSAHCSISIPNTRLRRRAQFIRGVSARRRSNGLHRPHRTQHRPSLAPNNTSLDDQV